MFEKDIQNAVRAELAAGTNPFQVAAKIDLPQYKDLVFFDLWFQQNVQAVVVNEVLGPASWYRRNERQEAQPNLPSSSSSSTRNSFDSQPSVSLPASNPWTGNPWQSSPNSVNSNPWQSNINSKTSNSSPWSSSSHKTNQNAWAMHGWKKYKGYNNLYYRHG